MTDEELLAAMWKAHRQSDKKSPHGRMARVLAIVEPEIRRRVDREQDRVPRIKGCQCHQEEGDSPCRVHGEEEMPPEPPSELCARKGCGLPRDAMDHDTCWKHCSVCHGRRNKLACHDFVPPAPRPSQAPTVRPQTDAKCATCGGSGSDIRRPYYDKHEPCPDCNGTGHAKES